jgi:hypothetical protein
MTPRTRESGRTRASRPARLQAIQLRAAPLLAHRHAWPWDRLMDPAISYGGLAIRWGNSRHHQLRLLVEVKVIVANCHQLL